jgi:hypothetical protein
VGWFPHLLFRVAGLLRGRTQPQAKNFLLYGGVIYLVLWIYGLLASAAAGQGTLRPRLTGPATSERVTDAAVGRDLLDKRRQLPHIPRLGP